MTSIETCIETCKVWWSLFELSVCLQFIQVKNHHYPWMTFCCPRLPRQTTSINLWQWTIWVRQMWWNKKIENRWIRGNLIKIEIIVFNKLTHKVPDHHHDGLTKLPTSRKPSNLICLGCACFIASSILSWKKAPKISIVQHINVYSLAITIDSIRCTMVNVGLWGRCAQWGCFI